MWYIPSDPQDTLRSQLEYETFKKERAEKEQFYEDIKRIAVGANQKSISAILISVTSLLISLASFVVQLLEYLR